MTAPLPLKISEVVSAKGYSTELARLQAQLLEFTTAIQKGTYRGASLAQFQGVVENLKGRIAQLQAGMADADPRPASTGSDPVFANAKLDVGRIGVSDLKSPFIGR